MFTCVLLVQKISLIFYCRLLSYSGCDEIISDSLSALNALSMDSKVRLQGI